MAYLADATLLVVDPIAYRIEAWLPLSSSGDNLIPRAGRYLDELGRDTLIVLVPPAEAVIVSLRPLRVIRRDRLPADAQWWSVAVGRRSGAPYVFGMLPDGRPVVAVLSPGDGREQRRYVLPRTAGPDWMPYYGIIAADEKRAYVSYHGSSTTGADILWFAGDSIRACEVEAGGSIMGMGCIVRAHGALLEYGGDILFATGTGAVGLIGPDLGDVSYPYVLTSVAGHVMEFDVLDDTLYAVAPCGYGRAVSAVPLPESPRRPSGPAGSICGSTIAGLGRGSLIAVGEAMPVISSLAGGRLLFVDAYEGTVAEALDLPAPAIDLLLLRDD